MREIVRRRGTEAGVSEPIIQHRFRHSMATWYLVEFPGDEMGLRRLLGQISDDVLRSYVHLSQQLIHQRAGRASLSGWITGTGR